ncbi:MAG: hypothetical protein HYY76_08860 [Acidobacteria bacterium]|nr:hypothetical protein [Acidobacteriota bacterium]
MTRRVLYAAAAAVVGVVALGVTPGAQSGGAPAAPARRGASGVPTPRMPDGRPDLSGMWSPGGGPGRPVSVDEKGNVEEIFPSRRCGPTQVNCDGYTNQSVDGEFTGRLNPNRALYKPEFWDKVQSLDMNTNKEDPLFICQPLGIPRVGPPARILQTANDVVFLYMGSGASSQPADYRVIPTDGRKHDPVRSQDVYFYGHSVGHWAGDTLVVDSIAFNDLTWLDRGGYFHSDQMHVVERFRREGNTLIYDVTVEDPEVLLEPWVVNTRRLQLNTNPNAYLPEGQPCRDYDRENMVTQIRH